jgi:hypothetical protein
MSGDWRKSGDWPSHWGGRLRKKYLFIETWKAIQGCIRISFYDITILQDNIKEVVSSYGLDAEQSFEEEDATCKV